jgi:lipid-A-disaccharide synthase
MQVNPELAARRSPPPVIALVAGELSGDQLGASLMSELKLRYPNAVFAGVGGPAMKDKGLDAWWDVEELAVMGLAEVLSHLPRLLRLRKSLARRLIKLKPDLMIGIDAPDFNLGLEKRLRDQGIKTVHYVSPTVWAWRSGRVKKIAAAADLVMCLFPFEPDFYQSHGVDARYTGHPMADQIPTKSDRAMARQALGLDPGSSCIALLPGSRRSEVARMSPHILGAAARLVEDRPDMQFVAPMATGHARRQFESMLEKFPGVHCTLIDGQARLAMSASDLVICTSGTATLEAMLINRPMVVVYRLSNFSYLLTHGLKMFKSPFFALPNILAGEELVPELGQFDANAERIAAECSKWLGDRERLEALEARFTGLHLTLRKNAAASAAECIQTLLEAGE